MPTADPDATPIPTVNSFISTVLESPPSCIEFCPTMPRYFVVGTYNLTKDEENPSDVSKQTREGSIMVFSLESETNVVDSLKLHGTYTTESAVLDLHFAPGDHKFAVALSTGSIWIYSLKDLGSDLFNPNPAVKVTQDSILVLSLAWHPSPMRATTIACSLSDGRVLVVDYSKPPYRRAYSNHSLEAWTVLWSPIRESDNSATLYSGGDDSQLRRLRTTLPPVKSIPAQPSMEGAEEHKSEPVEQMEDTHISDAKTHSAGVTAILPIWTIYGEALLTGSYDEFIRVLVSRTHRKWANVAEKRLDGGVWRLKQMSAEGESDSKVSRWKVLASCMHAGSRILMITHRENTWSIYVLAKFTEHESMNYGSDFILLATEEERWENRGTTIIASTSFYDRKLCIWKAP